MNVTFTCRGCDAILPWGQMRRLANGACDKCHSDRWSVKVIVSEGLQIDWKVVALEAGASLASGGLYKFRGKGIKQGDAEQFGANMFYADQVRELIDAGSRLDMNLLLQLMQAAAERDGAEHREALLAGGGRHCTKCQTLYASDTQRAGEKPWQAAGYCSRVCWRTDGNLIDFDDAEGDASTTPQANPNRLEVSCPNGHAFSVPKMFRGAARKCPDCQATTKIPEE